MAGTVEPIRKERLDKFLFFSRAIKSRTLAQKFIETGAIRVNSERTIRSDLKVGAGDV
ncbi:MAG: RNA-binding protein, partial [Devosia sp.]|nr:RNA-binding protein [Devosia sp.]